LDVSLWFEPEYLEPFEMWENGGYRVFKIRHRCQGDGWDDQIDIFGTRFDFLRNHGPSQEDRLLNGNQNDSGRDCHDSAFSDRLDGLACSLLESTCGFSCGVVTIEKRFTGGFHE
jgi:hypothetical protein